MSKIEKTIREIRGGYCENKDTNIASIKIGSGETIEISCNNAKYYHHLKKIKYAREIEIKPDITANLRERYIHYINKLLPYRVSQQYEYLLELMDNIEQNIHLAGPDQISAPTINKEPNIGMRYCPFLLQNAVTICINYVNNIKVNKTYDAISALPQAPFKIIHLSNDSVTVHPYKIDIDALEYVAKFEEYQCLVIAKINILFARLQKIMDDILFQHKCK